ncbi:MAG: macrolide ABC transporter ATP-binding protein [Deltaproteobacteria bacterium CG2_30_63_29]|nr:MAG: macrolide ABC transporter ATP-binding protein [Deltaproteobacteria bacterium CG2_30_63_29]PJB36865.1 MAG: macrolide ABC transporter ATP-binding protein [Deltaproteobacteria bacterium CG_4_9_14_3_um_filter_63_12]
MSTQNIVETHDLGRVYQQGTIEVHALKGVNFELAPLEFAALAGPSGSGKSTLLNLIGCLDAATSGSLTLDGRPVAKMNRTQAALFRLRRIGFIFQAYNLVPVLSAYENAEFTLYLQGVAKQKRREIVEPLMQRVGLANLMDRRPHEMSGGQQQRVAVVRAIASKPAVVLADEPTANLDSEAAIQLLELMQELNEEQGVTFLFASHDERVLEVAKRVIQLRDGEIVSDEVH